MAVDGEDVIFTLPNSIAPSKKERALKPVTQTEHETVKISSDFLSGGFSVQVAIEMAADIIDVKSPTHPLRVKKTSTMATCELKDTTVSLTEEFKLLVSVRNIHVPRMWIEEDPETGSRACMLTFYPEFEASPTDTAEIIFILDLSCSMKDGALDDLKKAVSLALVSLPATAYFNVLVFGSDKEEVFPQSVLATRDHIQKALTFVSGTAATMGSTDLWKPLRALFLLKRDMELPRNIFLFSDGHIAQDELVLDLVRENAAHARLFAHAVGPAPNTYFLQLLSRSSGGYYEIFEKSRKSKWEVRVLFFGSS